MDRIKILEVIPSLQNGGIEQFLYNYFSNMNLENFEIHILTQEPRHYKFEEKFIELGIKIYSVPTKKANFFGWLFGIIRILKQENYDIVHAHMTTKNFYVLILAKIFKVKVRISHSHENQQYIGIKKVFYKFFSFLSNIFATNFVACSKEAGKNLFGKKRVKNGEVTIIHNAIDLDKFKYNVSTRNKIRNEYSISNNTFIIGNVGRLVPLKNHKFILKVFKEINSINKNSMLMLIGDGLLKDEIRKIILDYNLENNVIMIDETQEIYSYYSAMDYFIFPSLNEGLGIVAIESQASCLKVIASSNLPMEIKQVDELVDFVDIDRGEKYWAQYILNKRTYDRKQFIDIMKNGNYDLKNESKKLENYYINLVRRNDV
jgi:glycosyltransferase EpsF